MIPTRDPNVGTVVRPVVQNPMFGATHEGRRCWCVLGFWRNGEGWYKLRDAQTGEVFESPDVFWGKAR